MSITVCGAGLAGCEAANIITKFGIKARLIEMKPEKKTPAHKGDGFAELICSNSLRSDSLENAVGLLKEELRQLGSLIMECADKTRVPAGGALAVDREAFSALVTQKITENPLIEIINKELDEIPEDDAVIIATGPLTTEKLSEKISELLPEGYLYFYDAVSPIVSFETIDMENAYFAARYNKGTPDYINCPMTKQEYESFYNELILAKEAELHEFDKDLKVFEGCMPVEVMAKRGRDTLLFGPLKPVGLINPKTNKEDYAVVQLRQDNSLKTLYNIVGFQTHLTFSEQKRVFSMIPALRNAEFVRFGVMHKNTFINSPKLLDNTYMLKKKKGLFFAGQITGVEGYIESAASGFLAGLNAARLVSGKEPVKLPPITAIGSMANYISDEKITDFQPMNMNFGLMTRPEIKFKKKKDKNLYISDRALKYIKENKAIILDY